VELARQRDLLDAGVTALAFWLGQPPDRLRAELADRTLADLEAFWEARLLDHSLEPVAACAALVGWLVRGERPLPEQIGALVGEALPRKDHLEVRVLAALSALVPAQALPAVLLAPPEGDDSAGWLVKAARLAATLTPWVPSLPVALAVPGDVLDRHLRSAPESQALALLREGLIEVPSLPEEAVARQLRAAGAPVHLVEPALRQVAASGADEELVASLGEAACALADLNGSDEAAVDRARSSAERFLHQFLDTHPATAGLFEMNGTLDFRFGNRPAEIDLVAHELRLAVELDGHYWHTRNPEAYRRDRRKDWELQRRGYIVLRFLAEDVVARLEEILDTILAAVRHRRQPEDPRGTR
jgi:hypothetical protein